ncbi:MAG: hypothetical protein E3J35_09425 [Methanomassiliicoccales archaeon]|nr:MAG: hypothetical protein E3J35_09425 [Methanomassiliicoccales archaeon]
MYQGKGIAFFLGAGFSSELGLPATRELRQVFQRFFPSELKDSFGVVEASLKELYSEEEYDIEKVYTFINDLLSLSENEVPVEISENLEHMNLLGRLVKENEQFRETLDKVRNFIMNLIEDEFLHRRMLQLDKVSEIFQDEIFSTLPPTHISILTTNYDLAIEKYFETYHPNVKLERGISDGVYDPKLLLKPGADSITLCKLHGSIDLHETKQRDVIHHPGPKNEYEGDYEITRMHLTAPIENRIQYEKIDEQLRLKLERDLRFASYIVVVGFSFRDPIIRDIFLRATMHGPRILVACGKRTKQVLSNSFFNEKDFAGDPLDRFTIEPYRFPSSELRNSISNHFVEIFARDKKPR